MCTLLPTGPSFEKVKGTVVFCPGVAETEAGTVTFKTGVAVGMVQDAVDTSVSVVKVYIPPRVMGVALPTPVPEIGKEVPSGLVTRAEEYPDRSQDSVVAVAPVSQVKEFILGLMRMLKSFSKGVEPPFAFKPKAQTLPRTAFALALML